MKIIYQDNKIIVCVKPSGILSTDESGGMPDLLRKELADNQPVRSIHRLDRMTGGVMVYALTKHAASDLSDQIKNSIFQKRYYAVTRGVIEPSSGIMRDWLHRDRYEKKTYVVPEGSIQAQMAELGYKVLHENSGFALMDISLHTGRTHQIRCQFADRGYPIVGDRKYGEGKDEDSLALWSYELSFLHPQLGTRMTFSETPPLIFPWSLFSEYIGH